MNITSFIVMLRYDYPGEEYDHALLKCCQTVEGTVYQVWHNEMHNHECFIQTSSLERAQKVYYEITKPEPQDDITYSESGFDDML